MTYATPTDLQGPPWNLDVDTDTAQRLLARASTVVRTLTLTAVYATDTDGAAVDDTVRTALRDATCAQAVWFDQTGDDGSGAAAAFSTMSLGSARLSVGGGGSATNTTVAESRFSPEAVQILSNAGLTGRAAQSW